MINVNVKYELDDLLIFSKREYKRTLNKALIIVFVVFMICALLLLMVDPFMSLFLVLFTILFPIVLKIMVNKTNKRNYENNLVGATFIYNFNEEHLFVEGNVKILKTTIEIRYENILLVQDAPDAYYLYFEQGRAYILPKKFLSDEECIVVKTLLLRAKEYKKLK